MPIQLSNHDEIQGHVKQQKDKILKSYGIDGSKPKVADTLTKSDFEGLYPQDKFEIYSIQKLDEFRQQIIKSEDIEDKDGFFKSSTSDLKSLIVYGEGKPVLLFVRPKKDDK